MILSSEDCLSSFNLLITVWGDTHINENSLSKSILLGSTFRILSASMMQDAMIPFGLRPIVIALYFIDIYIL